MDEVVFLEGKRVYLRPLDTDLIDTYQRWFNDPEVRSFVCTAYPLPKEKEQDIVEAMIKDENAVHLTIVVKEEKKPIGNLSLMKIDRIHRRSELGIVIGEKEFWDKGYGSEAISLMIEYGFKSLNLHRIFLCVMAFNKRAIKMYHNLGFKREGGWREAIFRDGRYHDLLFMGLLRREWIDNMRTKKPP